MKFGKWLFQQLLAKKDCFHSPCSGVLIFLFAVKAKTCIFHWFWGLMVDIYIYIHMIYTLIIHDLTASQDFSIHRQWLSPHLVMECRGLSRLRSNFKAMENSVNI